MKFHDDITRDDLLKLYHKQQARLKKIVARNDLQSKELLELNEELVKLATLDPMTNIYNRRYLLEVSERYLKTSKRDNTKLCAIMLDIDHFKNVNDTYGHDIGDKVIIACTEIVSANIRESDIFARFGGEEFVVIFPNTDAKNVFEISEKIRKLISQNMIDNDISVTVSIGLAQFNGEDDIDTLIKKADLGLYHAKEHGRNQVVDYESIN